MTDALANVRDEDKAEVNALLDSTYRNDSQYEYSDNLRIAMVDKYEQEQDYAQALAHGCCGFYDTVIECKSGYSYKVGFNYGH